jgi:hypothetical protein
MIDSQWYMLRSLCWSYLSQKSYRMRYFGPTMERDAYHFVKICHQCQIHKDVIHAPAHELKLFTSPWPFSQWELNLIGKIHPTSMNGHNYILVPTSTLPNGSKLSH